MNVLKNRTQQELDLIFILLENLTKYEKYTEFSHKNGAWKVAHGVQLAMMTVVSGWHWEHLSAVEKMAKEVVAIEALVICLQEVTDYVEPHLNEGAYLANGEFQSF